jgi:hypothetical protein
MADAPPQVKAYEADQPAVDFSQYWRNAVGIAAFVVVGLIGTVIWGFGSKVWD